MTAAGLGWLGWAAGRQLGLRHAKSPLLFAMFITLTLVTAWSLSGRLHWASVLPFTDVIYWSNWMPAILGLTAGVATTAPGLNRWHRPATIGLLLALGIGFLAGPVARPLLAPTGVTRIQSVGWRDGVCLQSHESSCGAAAAATLLAQFDIDVDETTMIRECWTSALGTEPLGLYRGLSRAGRIGDHRAVPTSRDPLRWKAGNQLPNVAIVKLKKLNPTDYLTNWFGAQHERHAVVVLGRSESGNWRIADPAVGLTEWSHDRLRRRFTGEAITLTPIQ